MSSEAHKNEANEVQRRFGEICVELGFCRTLDVLQALAIQSAERLVSERPRLIGEILLEGGILSREQVNEVLALLCVSRGIPWGAASRGVGGDTTGRGGAGRLARA